MSTPAKTTKKRKTTRKKTKKKTDSKATSKKAKTTPKKPSPKKSTTKKSTPKKKTTKKSKSTPKIEEVEHQKPKREDITLADFDEFFDRLKPNANKKITQEEAKRVLDMVEEAPDELMLGLLQKILTIDGFNEMRIKADKSKQACAFAYKKLNEIGDNLTPLIVKDIEKETIEQFGDVLSIEFKIDIKRKY